MSSADVVIELPADLPPNPTFDQLAPLTNYHRSAPFNIKEKTSRDEGGVTIRDITYSGEMGEPVDAFLVVPKGNGPFSAVLFEHGAGDSRDQYVDDAVALAAEQHVVGLVPTRPATSAAGGMDEAIMQIREMRHGLDLLAAQPGVDKSRLGYVGFSMGAVLGSELVPFESRLKSAVLMAAAPRVAANFFDPAVIGPHATATKVLFLFGTTDSYSPIDEGNAFAAFYPQKQVTWYEQPHSISAEYRADCAKWFRANL